MGPRKLWPDPPCDTLVFEKDLRRKGYRYVAGLDEVGRGPLAGPVVAACVILAFECDHRLFVDSKSIAPGVRLRLLDELRSTGATIGIGVVNGAEIDTHNILRASLYAMKEAIESSCLRPDFLLVDGNQPVPVSIPQQTLVKGESKSASIAAASIAAKVYRDRLMEQYHQQFPAYNFQSNKGYATAEHRAAIKEHGPCEIHRLSFRGVREHVAQPIPGRHCKENSER